MNITLPSIQDELAVTPTHPPWTLKESAGGAKFENGVLVERPTNQPAVAHTPHDTQTQRD